MEKKFTPHLALAHRYWQDHLRPGDTAIDATCGNGHDTEALARILLPHLDSRIIALDIQQNAIDQTAARLKKSFTESDLSKILLYCRCHTQLANIVPAPPQLIVYNLGYLPGADKSITTQTITTLQSIQTAASILAKNGALSITCYPGHPEGAQEEIAIHEWALSLPQELWQVCHHRWVNRTASPSLFWINKSF